MIGPVKGRKLLPCPFCGSNARLDNFVVEAVVWCTGVDCPARISALHSPKADTGIRAAQRKWNRRVVQQTSQRTTKEQPE